MVVLRAIGRFFARIGRWIRDTAWVQPLLIVGGIFGIIFSIPYITNFFSDVFNPDTNEADEYFQKYDLSYDGYEKKTSEVDNLFNYLIDISNGTSTDAQAKKYGDKFFLSFVQEGCPECPNLYGGLSTLQKNWKNTANGYKIDDGKSFKLHSIFIDETGDDDTDDEDVHLFEKYFLTERYMTVFEEAVVIAQSSDYCSNSGGQGGSYWNTAEKMIDEDGFQSPTTFLVDRSLGGIIEVIYNVDVKEGDTGDTGRALTLMDCWNRKGIFTADPND